MFFICLFIAHWLEDVLIVSVFPKHREARFNVLVFNEGGGEK
jgi:hypothetical protein